ncbi:protein dispatched homolog 1-like [Lineus longissimus]|uniref:protein dispatched homolog 1-like n=1 Tax=Lineus longissimus TaxID=88925 RepID=UPI002B4C42FD
MDNPSFETELEERGGHGDKCNEKLEETKWNGISDCNHNGDGICYGDAEKTKSATAEANGKVVAVDDVDISVIVAGDMEKEKKHFFLVRWICRYPCVMFWLALLGHLVFIVITAILYSTGYNIVNVNLEDLPIFNLHDMMYNRNLAWLQRESAYQVYLFNAQFPSKRKRRSIDSFPWVDPKFIYRVRHHLLYEVQENENVFTSRRLDAIRTFERKIMATFDKGAKRASPAHYVCGDDSVLSIVDESLSHLRKNITNEMRVGPYIGRKGVIDIVTGKVTARLARSFIILCWTHSFENITSWSVDEVIPEILKEEKRLLHPVGITLFQWNYRSFGELIFRQAYHDTLYLIGSVLFIFTFMWIQTSSLFVTGFGTASILTSFAGANLIYNCIVGYEYLGLFNILAIFVVLGIGADDIFIFYDTWKSLQDEENMEERMTLTFRRAGAAMFTTSLTTMVAFFVSSFSPILPISSFGTFAGLTVFVNYISVITYFPTVVAVHHRYFENCCSCKKKSETYDLNKASKPSYGGNRVFKAISTFFRRKYCDAVTHRIGKWIIMTLFIVLVAGMIYSCAKLRLDQRTYIKAFTDDNMMETGLEKTAFNYKIGAEDKMVMVYLVWGIGARNMSKCDKLKYTKWMPCSGEAVHDVDFNIERPENQLALLNVCRNLTHLQGKLKEDLNLQSAGNGTNQVVCFMEYFEQFLRTISDLFNKNGRKVDLKVPLSREDIEPLIPTLGAFVGLRLNATAVQNPVQTVMAIFIEKNATELKELIGFNETANVIGTDSHGNPVYDRKMTYAAVVVPLTKQAIRLQVDEGLRLQVKWEEYTEEIMKNMPAGVNKGWQVAGSWFISRQKKDLMYRGLTGVAYSLSLAFLVLLLTTRNFILAFLAEATLVGAVICVIGVIPIAGWNIGALESINVCFVAGLAVDYIVHVVEAYSMSGYKTKKDRTRDALGRIGVSVLSGAVTTLGSSFFMFFSRILFFMQFGTFIFCTVGFSLLFALLFFPAVLDTVGPSGNIGSFRWLFHKIKKCCGKHASTCRSLE